MRTTEIIPTPPAAPAPTCPATSSELFTHKPRPADVSSDASRQRYFQGLTPGVDNVRIYSNGSSHGAGVMRWADSSKARLSIDAFSTNGASFDVYVDLEPYQLRALARQLIDAAADIETHPAPVGAGATQ